MTQENPHEPEASTPPPVTPTPPPAPSPGAAPPPVATTQDERTMAMLCHLLGILTWFIGPLLIWLLKKDQSRFVDDQGKEALNFQITLLIAYVVGGITACAVVGFFILLAAWVCAIVFGIIAAVAANRGEAYRYPIAIRLIK